MENKKYLGVMVDCSRNAVLNVGAVKRLIDYLQKMGYNMLMLYTEDTYEVDNQPMFGYLRGRYTKEELKEIVAYGEEKGIELIPCIQTLAHLNQIFRWKEYKEINDCADILLCEDDRTYQLIEDMFSTVKQCYKTPWVHIGMDEAHSLGTGKYKTLHGEQNRFEILKKHLERVTEIAAKYDLKPMMWSDMFFRLATGGVYDTKDPSIITPEIAACVPDGVELVYWDYYSRSKAHYDTMVAAHKNFNKPVWFAGGAWTWTGFAPHNKMSFELTKPAMEACREQQVDNVMFTCWGDGGAECSVFHVLPALFYAAEIYRGNDDEKLIAKRFEELFGIGFDEFNKLDYPGAPSDDEGNHERNYDRGLLYNDAFMGLSDNVVESFGGLSERYARFASELKVNENHPDFGLMFKAAAIHCELLSVKSELGINTRKAYDAGDKKALAEVVELYKKAEQLTDDFFYAYRALWLHDKKGPGLEIQDYRLGGLRYRLTDCRLRLEAYLNGEIDSIDDLDQRLIPVFDKIRGLASNGGWRNGCTTNIT